MIRALSCVDVAEVRGQGGARQFDDRPGELDPGRAGADNDEGEQRRPPCLIALALRLLEGDQNAAPDGGRVFERLQSRRERLPIIMAEIGVTRAGRQHQRIVVEQ